MYLLDTNHCSLIMEGATSAVEHLNRVGDVLVGPSVIVRGELMYMVAKSERQTSNLKRVQNFLIGIQMYGVDEVTSEVYGRLKADLVAYFGPKNKSKRSKVTLAQLGISDNDLWIAATAMQHDLIVVSSDSDFTRISQVSTLVIEAW